MTSTLTDQIAEELFQSEWGLAHAAARVKTSHQLLKRTWLRLFGKDAYVERRKRIKGKAVEGDKHPTAKLTKETHWNYLPDSNYVTSQGYVCIHAPDWYTGWVFGNKRALEHIIVYCKHHGLTEIPKGFIVHHKDEIKTNNVASNLELLSRAEHARLHYTLNRFQFRKGSTTIPKGSRAERLEAHSTQNG